MYEPRWYQAEAKSSVFDFLWQNPPVIDPKTNKIKIRNPLVCMPTGTGKSLAIADIGASLIRAHPQTRVAMVTHVKELIAQNAAAMAIVWPDAPIGIYSAGLKRRELNRQIMYGGIASVKNVIDKVGHVDYLMIDEAHLLNPNSDTMYQKIIEELRKTNPYLIVVGFTATPYRMGIGTLTNNGIFTDTAYDITTLDMFNRLVYEGWLAPLVPIRRKAAELDLRGVGIQNGDYKINELQERVDQSGVTGAIVRDMMRLAWEENRRCGLVFAAGVDHAEHISECFEFYGWKVPAFHSKLTEDQRRERMHLFKTGQVWGLVNNNVLTTGFDHPPIDFIGMVRPTMSTGLHVQMLGRGTRPSRETGKHNCLVADYAGNVPKLGPINDPVIPQLKKKGPGGEAPVWCCDACNKYNHARAPICIYCGNPHDMTGNLSNQAGEKEVMKSAIAEIELFEVDRVLYLRHKKEGKPDSIRVQYCCGLRTFSEWVMLEHPEPVAHHAREWWRQRYPGDPPATTDEALAIAKDTLKMPVRIKVWTNTEFPQVTGFEF